MYDGTVARVRELASPGPGWRRRWRVLRPGNHEEFKDSTNISTRIEHSASASSTMKSNGRWLQMLACTTGFHNDDVPLRLRQPMSIVTAPASC